MKRGSFLVLAILFFGLALSTGASADQRITALAPFDVFADAFLDPRGIAIDASGNVYVTGYSIGVGTFYDYATVKYSPSGTRAWVARYNGPGNTKDRAWAIGIDGRGNVYVAGDG